MSVRPPVRHSREAGYAHVASADDIASWIRRHASEHGFTLDAAQDIALAQFTRLARELRAAERRRQPFFSFLGRRPAVRGLYIWGGVGRGKSFLMDSFFACVPTAGKRRVHFHRFMQQIHAGLRRLQGEEDPLSAVARDIARRSRLLCLDEFHIADITDAMLMRRLLEGLIEQGVALVTTSNFHPESLYAHGLQRNQFLPAIELIKDRLEIINVDDGTDYRLRQLERAGVYHVEREANRALQAAFRHIANDAESRSGTLEIEGRMIPVRRYASGVAWFDFEALCGGPRGPADYIELARRYETVLISGVPRFSVQDADRLRRFVWLIDEFYDRRVKLILSAAARPEHLFDDAAGGDRFQAHLNASLKERLVSRLTEMQTRDYLTKPHLP